MEDLLGEAGQGLVVGSSSGCTSWAHAGVGHGTIVQFVVRSLTTDAGLADERAAGRGRRGAGSRSSSSPGVAGPVRPMRAQRRRRRARGSARRTTAARSRASPRRRRRMPRALDVHVEVLHVDELRAVAVGAGRQRADHRLLAELGADRDDLAGLHVGREADDEVGEALEGGRVEGDVRGARHRRDGTARGPAARRSSGVVDDLEHARDARDVEDPLDRPPPAAGAR